MKTEDKKELISTIKKSKKIFGIFSVIFTLQLILVGIFSDSYNFKVTLIMTLLSYIIYVFIRYIDKKLS